MMDWTVLFPDLLETYGIPRRPPIWKTVMFFAVTTGLLYALWGPILSSARAEAI
jgi:hypothetical protein